MRLKLTLFRDTRLKNLFLSGTSNLILKFLSIIVNLVSVPITLNYLGTEQYGIWLTITSLVALLGFLDLGLGSGLVNQISESVGVNDKTLAQKSIFTTFILLVIISIILFVLNIFFGELLIKKIFTFDTIDSELEIIDAVKLLLFFIILFIPFGLIQRIYDGLQSGYIFNYFSLIGVVINLLTLLITIYFKGGLFYLIFSLFIGTLVSSLFSGIYLLKRVKYLTFKWHFFHRSLIKQILSQGFMFFIMTTFTILAYTTDNLIISKFLGYSDVTRYELVKKMFSAAALSQYFIVPMWPMFNEAIESKSYEWTLRITRKILIIGLFSSFIFSLPLLLFGNKLIQIWTTNDYLLSSSLLLGFFCFILISTIGGILSAFLNTKTFLVTNTILIIVSSVCSVVLKLLYIDSFGVEWVIWATSISYAFFYIIPGLFIINNYFQKLKREV